jgi:hypothetical protein
LCARTLCSRSLRWLLFGAECGSVSCLAARICFLCVYNVLLRGHICHALCVAFSNSFVSVVGAQILRAQYSLSGIEWSGVSPGAKHLIRSLMTLRADQRYTVQQALRHPWLHGIPYAPTPGMGAGGREAECAAVAAAGLTWQSGCSCTCEHRSR